VRKLPTILAGLFLAITLERVANLVSGPIGSPIVLAYLYAGAMGAMIYTAMYWSRTQTLRHAALIVAAVFVIADGAFNLFETLRSADTSTWYLLVGAWVYGLLPTCAAGLAGWLQGKIDKLPPVQHKPGVIASLRKLAVERIEQLQEPAQDKPVVHIEIVKPETYAEYAELCSKRNGQGPLTSKELQDLGVKERTSYEWPKRYRKELSKTA
jgi:hypothetical protein